MIRATRLGADVHGRGDFGLRRRVWAMSAARAWRCAAGLKKVAIEINAGGS